VQRQAVSNLTLRLAEIIHQSGIKLVYVGAVASVTASFVFLILAGRSQNGLIYSGVEPDPPTSDFPSLPGAV
jgi:hypothetical protein